MRANIATVLLNRELTTLRHDLVIEQSLEELAWSGPKLSEVDALLDLLEIKALKDRIHALGGAESAAVRAIDNSEISSISAQGLNDKLAGRSDPIAIYSPGLLRDGGFSVALSPSEVYLVDEPAGNWVTDPALPKWVHNAKYLLKSEAIAGIVFDTELAAYLINPGGRNLELTDLAERFLELSVTDDSQDLFSTFNPILARVIYELVPLLQSEIANRQLTNLLDDLEMPTMFELTDMEKLGVAVDRKKLESLSTFFANEVARETSAAHQVAGHEFNVGSPKQLQVVLFDEIGLPKTRR